MFNFQQRHQIWRTGLFVFACLLAGGFLSEIQPESYTGRQKYFDFVQRMLAEDGFDKDQIQKFYQNPKARFDLQAVSLYFRHNESRINYDQFADPELLQKARTYINTHESIFLKAERDYGVEKEIITAIILVESLFGSGVGRHSVFNTLSSMASLADPSLRDLVWARVERSGELTREEFEKKADRKSSWAYNELKAFLTYIIQENIPPFKLYGSYAGAMGICQFMPSNLLTLGADGNGDGRIDLMNHADAIMSVARYLNHYGWYCGIPDSAAFYVLYEYNRSSYYVNILLKIAQLLKER